MHGLARIVVAGLVLSTLGCTYPSRVLLPDTSGYSGRDLQVLSGALPRDLEAYDEIGRVSGFRSCGALQASCDVAASDATQMMFAEARRRDADAVTSVRINGQDGATVCNVRGGIDFLWCFVYVPVFWPFLDSDTVEVSGIALRRKSSTPRAMPEQPATNY